MAAKAECEPRTDVENKTLNAPRERECSHTGRWRLVGLRSVCTDCSIAALKMAKVSTLFCCYWKYSLFEPLLFAKFSY